MRADETTLVERRKVKKSAMEKLLKMGVLETAVSPWAANDAFVRKKDVGSGLYQTSGSSMCLQLLTDSP